MTDAQLRAFVDNWLDHPRFAAEALTIPDEAGAIVPLRLTPAQIKLDNCIKRQERSAKPVRGIVLKARRVHISAGVAAQAFHRLAFFPNMHGLVVSHLKDSAEENYKYYSHYDGAYRKKFEADVKAGKRDPGYLGVALPKLLYDAKDGMEWANGSTLDIGTDGSSESSRGGSSKQFLHLTEFAFWDNAEITMRALGQTIPSRPGTMQLIESSANGMSGLFYELWMDAQRADSDVFSLFFAWWEHPDYWMEPPDPTRFQDSLSREERELQQRYSLHLNQMYWRRWAIRNKCQGSIDTFHQEYPSEPEEAFLTSGRPRFDLVSIGRQPVRTKPITGSLSFQQVGLGKRVIFDGREDGHGVLEMWEQPQKGRNYVIGADAASGIDRSAQKGGASNPDYSCAQVLDAQTREQVASFRDRLSPGRFAEYLWLLGAFYNWAYIVPERNRDGMAVIECLTTVHVDHPPYPVERLWVDPGRMPNDRRPPQLHEIGYNTSDVSKPVLIEALDSALREMSIIIRKANTIAELRAYCNLKDGKMGGVGAHDDEVIALALAVVGLRRAPQIFVNPVEVRKQIEMEEYAELERYTAPHRRPGWNR